MADALSTISTRTTPQSEKARPEQVRNNAGGYTFAVGDWGRLHRFLTLGVEGGTYYVGARELAADNAQVVFRCAAADHARTVQAIIDVSLAGRAPRQNPAIFALAVCASVEDTTARAKALDHLGAVCRTGTHLFLFAGYVEALRGWGRSLRRAVGRWYESMDPTKLAYQVLKYRQREGWTHADMLRLSHPEGVDDEHRALYQWITHRTMSESLPGLVGGFETAQQATGEQGWLDALRRWPDLSWEMLPDEALTKPAVWEALLHNGVPMTALIRQLPRLTGLGVVGDNLGSAATRLVLAQLGDSERIRRARIHPMNVLVALRTYAQGRSVYGKSTWTPSAKVIDALDGLFYASYGNVESSGKRELLALDVSGSMTQQISGLPLSCREASAALALVTANAESDWQAVAFTGRGATYRALGPDAGLSMLPISPRQRLDDAVAVIDRLPFGPTDCAAPMVWAMNHKVPVDTFTIYTDSETWYGPVHPHQALERYRQVMGIDSRLVVVAMTSTQFSIADPNDPLQLDIAGFDTSVPSMRADFSAGRL